MIPNVLVPSLRPAALYSDQWTKSYIYNNGVTEISKEGTLREAEAQEVTRLWLDEPTEYHYGRWKNAA